MDGPSFKGVLHGWIPLSSDNAVYRVSSDVIVCGNIHQMLLFVETFPEHPAALGKDLSDIVAVCGDLLQNLVDDCGELVLEEDD